MDTRESGQNLAGGDQLIDPIRVQSGGPSAGEAIGRRTACAGRIIRETCKCKPVGGNYFHLTPETSTLYFENAVLQKRMRFGCGRSATKRSGLGEYRIRGSASRSRNLAKQREPVVSSARLLCSAVYATTTSGMPRDERDRSVLRDSPVLGRFNTAGRLTR